MLDYKTRVDTRKIPQQNREQEVLKAFDSLEPGEKMELIGSNYPKNIHEKLKSQNEEDEFEWESLEEGPDVWRIAIRKD